MMRACWSWGARCEIVDFIYRVLLHHHTTLSHSHLLVVAGGVPCELQNLSAEVLKHGREVDGGAGADAAGVLVLLEVPADTRDRELKAGLGGLGEGLATSLTAPRFPFARHCEKVLSSCRVESSRDCDHYNVVLKTIVVGKGVIICRGDG